MLKTICEVKLMDKNTSELMTMLGLTVLMERAAKANAPRCFFGHVSKTENNPERMTLNFEESGKRKKHMERKS